MLKQIRSRTKRLAGLVLCSIGRHHWQARDLAFGGRTSLVMVCDRDDCPALKVVGTYPPPPPKAA